MNWLAKTAVVAALYAALGKVGFLLAIPPGNVTPFWLPAGIAWAAVLFWGPRVWPGIWLGSFLVNTVFFPAALSPSFPAIAAVIATGSTLQALMGTWLVRWFSKFPDPLRSVRGVVRFSLLVPVCCMLASSIGVGTMYAAGMIPAAFLLETWLTWWLGDAIGVMVVTPLLLTWTRPQLFRPIQNRLLEGAALLILAVAASWHIFWSRQDPLTFTMIPFVVWAAVRFGPAGVTLCVGVISSMALTGSVQGFGPFSRMDILHALLYLQIFIGIMTVTGLLLSASVAERDEAVQNLRKDHGELKMRMRDTQMQLMRADKLQAIGKLSAGIAHEVKNALAALLMGVDYLSRHRADEGDSAAVLKEMAQSVGKADGIIKGLLDFSGTGKLEMAPCDLNAVIDKSLLLIRHELRKRRVELVLDLDSAQSPVMMDEQKMQQVFLNLFLNAADAMPQGGTLSVRTKSSGSGVMVEIEDSGAGILPENFPKLYDLFFTTKPAGTGTGIGLVVTRAIMEMHGGTIEIKNREPQGVRVVLRLKAGAGQPSQRRAERV